MHHTVAGKEKVGQCPINRGSCQWVHSYNICIYDYLFFSMTLSPQERQRRSGVASGKVVSMSLKRIFMKLLKLEYTFLCVQLIFWQFFVKFRENVSCNICSLWCDSRAIYSYLCHRGAADLGDKDGSSSSKLSAVCKWISLQIYSN